MPRASVIVPYQPFWDDDTRLSGGALTAFYSDTGSKARSYQNPEFTLPQANPYRLDASGRILGSFRFSSTVDMSLSDPDGEEVYAVDRVQCFDDSSVFADFDSSVVYGEGGQNLVTGSDGAYYLSLILDNLNNDPTDTPAAWAEINFINTDASGAARLASIGEITPANQAILIGGGSLWTSALLATLTPNYLAGLDTSNSGGDLDHDIVIASGRCADSTNALSMSFGGMTKRIDATWAAGTNAGGLASGAVLGNNTTYHVFIVQIGSSVDAMFDTSLVCANGVANNAVTNFRRIASLRTDGSANIVPYFQSGDYFYWNVLMQDVSAGTPGDSPVLTTLSVPGGISVTACIYLDISSVVTETNLIVNSALAAAQEPTTTVNVLEVLTQTGDRQGFGTYFTAQTNTSRQIRREFLNGILGLEFNLHTIGWIDTRGQ